MKVDSPQLLIPILTGSIKMTGSINTTGSSVYINSLNTKITNAHITGSINFAFTASYLQNSYRPRYVTKTSNYSVVNTDDIVYVRCSNSNINITLPTTTNAVGKVFIIKKIDTTGYYVNVTGSIIDDKTSGIILTQPYSSITLHNSASRYYIN